MAKDTLVGKLIHAGSTPSILKINGMGSLVMRLLE